MNAHRNHVYAPTRALALERQFIAARRAGRYKRARRLLAQLQHFLIRESEGWR